MDRILKTDLRGDQNRERAIRTAFLQVTLALSARPSGRRGLFDNAARAKRPSAPWEKTQVAVRAAAMSAAQDGRPLVISETRSRIEAFYDALRADALSALPAESDLCVIQAVLRQAPIQGAADVAEHQAVARPTCRQTMLNLAQKVRDHIRALAAVATAAERAAHNPQPSGMRQWG